MNDGLDATVVLGKSDEKPSKQYRTSPYTVRQYCALSYVQRRAVDAACDEQAGMSYTNHQHPATDTLYTVGRRTSAAAHTTGSETPYQSQPSTSQPSSPMTSYVHPAPSPALHTLNTPELIEHDETHPDNEHTSALPVVAQKADLLSASTEASLATRHDIVAVAGHYVNLIASQEDTDWTHWGYSPFLGGDTHSFAVNETTGMYKCFTSLRSGGAVDLVMFMEEISQQEAENWLATTFPEPLAAANERTIAPIADEHQSVSVADGPACAYPHNLPNFPELAQATADAATPTPAAPVAVEGTVYSTTDYDLFHSLPQNRDINQNHVRKLIGMIQQENLLYIEAILVTETMGILDGQHRLAAARELGVPIFYKIGKGLSQSAITTLNTASRNWQGPDWMKYYAVEGKPAYVALMDFMQRHPRISFSNAKIMLSGQGGGGTKADNFRAGLWKGAQPADIQLADEVAELVERIAAEVPTFKQPSHTGFVTVLYQCLSSVEGFESAEMMRTILANPRSLVPCASHRQWVEMLSDIYNYRKHESKRIPFKFKVAEGAQTLSK